MESSSTLKMASLQSDVKRHYCKVCFNVFDDNDRRPRSLPCGHTICSKCVSDNLKESKLVCPSCRREHEAVAYTDFPVNYELESVIQEMSSSQPSLSKNFPPCDEPRGISKKLKSLRLEFSSGMEGINASSQEAISQLHLYTLQMKEWKGQHQEVMEEFSTIVCKHEDMIKHIEKESSRVEDTIKEGKEETERVKVAEDNLAAASTAHDIFPALEEADHSYNNLDRWTRRVNGHFPDTELKTQSLKLREQTNSALQTLSVPEKEEKQREGISFQSRLIILSLLLLILCQNLFTSSSECQQKSYKLFMVQNLKHLISLDRHIIESGRVYAVQESEGGGRRWAKITLCKNLLCLHVLNNYTSLPDNAIVYQHSDVLSLVDPSSRLTFLELGAGGSTFGRLYIRLTPNTLRAQHFTILSTGELGPSYANTSILEINDSESVRFGDYEMNDGSGGKALIPWRNDEKSNSIYSRRCLAGTLKGWSYSGLKNVAQFVIRTRDRDSYICHGSFGLVEDGLAVLTKALSLYHPNLKDIIIQDCGIVILNS